MPAVLSGNDLPAQTYAPQATQRMQQPEASAEPDELRRGATAHGAASMQSRPASEAIAAGPPAPPAPIWPAHQAPSEARVSWDSRGLEIEAHNSSLIQILRQVLGDTGVTFQGLAQDQHIFGTYGPGPPRDVLAELLDGSGYNVLILGGRDTHTPLEIVLSVDLPARLQTAANNRNGSKPEDDDADPPPESPHPPPMETPFGNGDSGKPETPQQIMQDILSRQRKIDQQQQEEQQNHPQQ
ncbi:MAG TPA: hypothetical protein VHZ09_03440 [Acidobacteriaceae bacterium]|nr:hypothetical protein [Acidobacteriaceae bacterium]